MWALVEPLLEKFVLDELVALLVKAGVISQFTGSLVRTADDLKIAVSDIKFYHDPTDFPDPSPGETNTSNIGVTNP